jgi:hypothetical protein
MLEAWNTTLLLAQFTTKRQLNGHNSTGIKSPRLVETIQTRISHLTAKRIWMRSRESMMSGMLRLDDSAERGGEGGQGHELLRGLEIDDELELVGCSQTVFLDHCY